MGIFLRGIRQKSVSQPETANLTRFACRTRRLSAEFVQGDPFSFHSVLELNKKQESCGKYRHQSND